jgi:hypothetical protein
MKEGTFMSKKLIFPLWGFFVCIFVIGCATSGTSLKDYKPKSGAEAEIKESLLNLEEAQNKGDTQKALALMHDDVRFQDGCRSPVMVSKKEVADILKRSVEYGCTRKYLSPRITIKGNQADVKVSVLYDCKSTSRPTFVLPSSASMVRESDEWLILKYEVVCP